MSAFFNVYPEKNLDKNLLQINPLEKTHNKLFVTSIRYLFIGNGKKSLAKKYSQLRNNVVNRENLSFFILPSDFGSPWGVAPSHRGNICFAQLLKGLPMGKQLQLKWDFSSFSHSIQNWIDFHSARESKNITTIFTYSLSGFNLTFFFSPQTNFFLFNCFCPLARKLKLSKKSWIRIACEGSLSRKLNVQAVERKWKSVDWAQSC